MSDTPRSNEVDSLWETSYSVVDAFNRSIDLCRTLESELAAASAKIQRLIEAGDAIVENGSVSERLEKDWTKAKEVV